jgi:hypothetical protein
MTSSLQPMQAPHVVACAHAAHEVYVGVPVHVGWLGALPSPVLLASAASAESAASGALAASAAASGVPVSVPVLEEHPPANT